MPAVSAYIELRPAEDTWTPTLEGIEERLIDIRGVYSALYATFRVIERRRFDREGPGWAPLAPSTVAGRIAMGITGEHPILNRKGVTYEGEKGGSLRKSFTTKGNRYSVVEPMPDGVFIGSKHPLAIYHQTGTHRAGRDHNVSMPARPLVDLTEADAELFSAVISDYVWGFEVGRSAVYDAEDTAAVDMVGAGV